MGSKIIRLGRGQAADLHEQNAQLRAKNFRLQRGYEAAMKAANEFRREADAIRKQAVEESARLHVALRDLTTTLDKLRAEKTVCELGYLTDPASITRELALERAAATGGAVFIEAASADEDTTIAASDPHCTAPRPINGDVQGGGTE